MTDKATLGADGTATLEGNVVVRQGDREIRANQLQYDPHDTSLTTDGHIDYTDPLVHVTGAGGSYSAAAGAEFKGAEFDLRQRAARGAAQDMKLTPQGIIRLTKVMFTTCPAKDTSWQLKADSIVLDTRNKIGTGRDAQVDFMGVPLIYLPWVSFPLGNERKSGFLFPGIGNTSNGGLQLSVPYYWNIAPNADFTFQPIVYSRPARISAATCASSAPASTASSTGITCPTTASSTAAAAACGSTMCSSCRRISA